MCGVGGILGHYGDGEINIIVNGIKYPGPEGESRKSGKKFAIGFRRLVIVDEFGGMQPLLLELMDHMGSTI